MLQSRLYTGLGDQEIRSSYESCCKPHASLPRHDLRMLTLHLVHINNAQVREPDANQIRNQCVATSGGMQLDRYTNAHHAGKIKNRELR